MSTNVTPVKFDETGNTLTVVKQKYDGGFFTYSPTKIDFQEHGIMLEYLDVDTNTYRVFLPYEVIDQIHQVV